jgi:negative regulator of sigma-B (phosphoserine phosphatase)
VATLKDVFVGIMPLLEYAVSSTPSTEENESGDLCLVTETERGVLVAVVDGAGHGAEAASAARLALETLRSHANEGVIALTLLCHERLKGTRGVVMSLASFDGIENTVTWLGIGNIEGILLRGGPSTDPRPETIFLRPGIVGYRLPPLRAVVEPVSPGDLLILITDGICNNFARQFSSEDPPAQIAGYIATNFRRANADGLVLVARYLGPNE